ncbi:uncharacterized protein N7529_004739 [Penicillium soppii]|uniref:uncharacterized protein n=1 Tax=Penicillium soppii TaxID=69789 RepID=UPI00254773F9|nr:uncharacterized protein N7529_004739 [Penicillium soppii]KAJ5872386.1 hypothetical protein N7529_004739 [Penicillium soppii]
MSETMNNFRDSIIILEGECNWAMWKVTLQSEISSNDDRLWGIITGKEARPRDFVLQASTTARLGTKSSISSPSISLDPLDEAIISEVEKAQGEWDHRNGLALTYIQSTINTTMAQAVHIEDCHLAYEAFESLRKICERNPPFTAYTTAVRWLTYKYEPEQNPHEFVQNWAGRLADMQMTQPSSPVSERLCCQVFLAAVINNPACHAWLDELSYDKGVYTEPDIVALYGRFRELELRRISLEEQQEDAQKEKEIQEEDFNESLSLLQKRVNRSK